MVLRQLLLPLRAMLMPSSAQTVRVMALPTAQQIGTAISGLETLEGDAQALETDVVQMLRLRC